MPQISTKTAVIALIPIVLSIGMAPALTDLFLPDADALQKSMGRATQSFGSRMNAIVCGAQLCADVQGPNISSFNIVKQEAIGSLRDQQARNSDEAATICRDGQVLTFHFARNNHICTSQSGADMWERTGQAEKVVPMASDDMMTETDEMTTQTYDDSMEETHDSMEETHDESIKETHDDSMEETMDETMEESMDETMTEDTEDAMDDDHDDGEHEDEGHEDDHEDEDDEEEHEDEE